MPLVRVENRDGIALNAEIYQNSELVGVTDSKGELDLPTGDYKATSIGYDEKRFRVHNNPVNPVVMSVLNQQNSQSKNGIFKDFKQQDWFILLGVSIVVLYSAYYHRSK